MKLGEYLPDLPDLDNPGLTRADDVFPTQNGYIPWPSLQAFTGALDARARGGIYARDKDGNVYMYAGDASKLYSINGTSWDDYSKGGGYSLATTENWEFVKWGEQILACSGVNGAATNNLQAITMGSTAFADLGGTPPQARHMTVVRDFVVLGNTWDSTDGNVPNRVRWSGINDNTTWAVSSATQADFQDLQGAGGWVQRVTGGEYGLVFQEFSVWRMSYVGTPLVWQFDEVLPGKGTPAPGSVAQFGDMVFFLSQDGFEVVANGARSELIGSQKVDRTFWNSYDSNYPERITATVDPFNRRVYWAYPESGNTDGEPNRILCYDWSLGRWVNSNQNVQQFFVAATDGTDLDAMDAEIASSATELTTNGSFASDSDWTKGAGWTISAGVASHASGTASVLSQSASISQGMGLYVTFTVSGRSAGSVTATIGGTAGTARSTNATFSETIHAGATTLVEFSATSDFDGSIDNVSVKSVSLDGVSDSLDARTWKGGAAQVGAFNEDNRLAFFSGSSTGVLETGEAGHSRRVRLRGARPTVDGGSVSVQFGHRNTQSDGTSWTGTATVNTNGMATRRVNARYHRIRLNLSGDYFATGVETDVKAGGGR